MIDKKASPAFIKTISNFVIFRSCSYREIERRFKNVELVELTPGEALYSRGDKSSGVFLIESGNLKMIRQIQKGNSIVIRLINKRNIVGVESLFSEEPFPDTAIAIDKVRAYLLNEKDFTNLIFSNKTCYDGVIELMNKDLISARSRIISLSQKRAKQRLAESILWVGDFFGMDEDKGIRYKLRPGELATLSGTTLANLYKLLALFESLAFINYKYNRLHILEPKKLLHFANVDLSNRLK